MFGKSKVELRREIRELQQRNRSLEDDLRYLNDSRKKWLFTIPWTGSQDAPNETDAWNLANVLNYLSKQGIPAADITWDTIEKDLVFAVEYVYPNDLTKPLEEIVGLCGVDKTESPDGTGNA